MTFNDKVYDTMMNPLEKLRLARKRRDLLVDVAGDVLEIGYGTGANLKYYPYEQLDSLTLIDHSMPEALSTKCLPKKMPFTIYAGDAQALPFNDESFDSVVFTLVFCSVDDPVQGLSEVYRVLKPGGRVYFMEHVLPAKQPYIGVFNKLTPMWKKAAHGCHLNRDTVTHIQQSGLSLIDYHRFFRTSFVVGIAAKA